MSTVKLQECRVQNQCEYVVISGEKNFGVEVVGGCALLDNVVVERSAGSGVVAINQKMEAHHPL